MTEMSCPAKRNANNIKINTIKDSMQRECKIKWTLDIATHFINTAKLKEMYNSEGKINNWKPNQ